MNKSLENPGMYGSMYVQNALWLAKKNIVVNLICFFNVDITQKRIQTFVKATLNETIYIVLGGFLLINFLIEQETKFSKVN